MSSTKITLSALLRTVPFAINSMWAESPLLCILIIAMTVLDGLFPAAALWIAKYVIDATVAVFASGGDAGTLYHAFFMYAIQSAVLAGASLLRYLNNYAASLLGKRLYLGMTSGILSRLSDFDMGHFDDPDFYNIASRASAESGSRPLSILSGLTSVISGLITSVTMVSLLSAFCWPLVFVAAASCVPYLFIRLKLGKMAYDVAYGRTQDGRTADFIRSCMLNRAYIPEIMSFGLWGYLHQKWYRYASVFLKQDMSIIGKQSLSDAFVTLMTGAVSLCVSIFIVYKAVKAPAPLTVGSVVMYVGVYAGTVKSLAGLGGILSGLYSDMLFLTNMIAFHAIKSQPTPTPTARPQPQGAINTMELRGVSFKYPGSDVYVLRDINLRFDAGRSTLIVGVNGAGKTTLIKLLLGLYEPTGGSILVNGEDMRRYDTAALRAQMGVIFQDYIRYPFTALENIGVGDVERVDDLAKVRAAAVKASVDDVIQQLPLSYSTPLTRQWSNGVDLSMGQWQRICLARLFIRNGSVNIFDEPTASLDTRTEAALLKRISTLSSDRICILITHRIMRGDIADRIVVINGGRIVEEGGHDELIDYRGEYWNLWNLSHFVA